MAKRYNLQTEIARVKAEHPPFELQLPEVPGSGEEGQPDYVRGYGPDVVLVPSTQTMPDDAVLYANTQPVRAARILLGEKWDHYVAAGGTANVLWSIVSEHNGATSGESSPSENS